jgi:hypothetical protein
VGLSANEIFDPAQTFNANRAFIQCRLLLAGAWDVMAYTPSSGTGSRLSAETRRTTQIIGQGDFAHGGAVVGVPDLFISVAPNAGSLSGGDSRYGFCRPKLAHREVAAAQFANSIQRMVEVFVETVF